MIDSNLPATTSPLYQLFRANRWRVIFTYALFSGEYLLHLAQPVALGFAINGLLVNDFTGLIVLIVQHLSWLSVATARRLYDTRAFTAIYTDTASRIVAVQRSAGICVSAVAARSALSRELVEFFEHELKAVFASIYGVIGALLMLLIYDWVVAVFCLVTLTPLVLLNRRLARRSLGLNSSLNDQLEREVGVIEDGRREAVEGHYRALAGWRIRLSDQEAWNFFRMEFFILGLIVAAMARYCTQDGIAAGDIYAVFAYVMMFVGALDNVPEVIQQLARLKDIGRRVVTDDQPIDEGETPAANAPDQL